MRFVPLLLGVLFLAACAPEEEPLPLVTVYKTPTCGCCALWVEHLEGEGFPVETVDLPSLDGVKQQYGVPDSLASCHTGVVDGYVVEGHVPAEDVRRLLRERPEAGGLAVPGMPVGSPGMEVPDGRTEPYAVLLIRDGAADVFSRHGTPSP
ncbi:MAG: DUF411 domain-containing protein [Rubricoccaceae bacterium]|nr:DUF411 domain-containing protein [Rubricoccaceae bacterium]